VCPQLGLPGPGVDYDDAEGASSGRANAPEPNADHKHKRAADDDLDDSVEEPFMKR
jgi:hypothetical protein